MLRALSLIVLVLAAAPAGAATNLAGMAARLEIETAPDGSKTVSLPAGGPLGLGGIAAGAVHNGSSGPALWLAGSDAVSGVDPSPFFPVGQGDVSGIEPSPFAPEGVQVLSFHFDPAGDFSGVEPSPFKVFLATPGGFLGELSFDGATAELGSLTLSGVELKSGGGNEELPTFTIQALAAEVPSLPGTGLWLAAALLLLAAAIPLGRRAAHGMTKTRPARSGY